MSKGFFTIEINTGACLPNCEKLRNLTLPSKLNGMASCRIIPVISSTNNS